MLLMNAVDNYGISKFAIWEINCGYICTRGVKWEKLASFRQVPYTVIDRLNAASIIELTRWIYEDIIIGAYRNRQQYMSWSFHMASSLGHYLTSTTCARKHVICTG